MSGAVVVTPVGSPSTALEESSGAVGTAQHAVVFLRDEGEGPFVPFYHPNSITLREVQEEFHISSVLECDQGGNVHPRAVAFDSPSDVLRSGRHYIAKRDLRPDDGANSVTFRSKIMVKEYDLEHNAETPKGPSVAPTSSVMPDHPVATPYPRRGPAERGKENPIPLASTYLPGVKRSRAASEEEAIRMCAKNGSSSTSSSAPRFIPFTADVDGSGENTLVTIDMLRQLCEEDLEVQEAEYRQKHEETEQLIASARRVLFLDGE
eukprot:gene11477-7945_t